MLQYPNDRLFHRAHTWAIKTEAASVRVGLSSFAVRLIGQARSVVFSPPDMALTRNQPGCWLVDESGPIPIRMPVSGRIIRVNRQVIEHPQLISQDPYESGWLLEIDCDDADQELAPLERSVSMAEHANAEWLRFQLVAERKMKAGHKIVGPTLQDGGERLSDLRSMLGALKYRRLVMQFM